MHSFPTFVPLWPVWKLLFYSENNKTKQNKTKPNQNPKKPHEYRNGTCLTHTSTVSNGSISITFFLQRETICCVAPYFTMPDIVSYFLHLGRSTFTATHKILYPPSSSFFIFLMTPVISHLFLHINTRIYLSDFISLREKYFHYKLLTYQWKEQASPVGVRW